MLLTLLDLDQTILRGDSDCLWTDFLIEKGVLDAADTRRKLDGFMRQYQAGQMDILEYMAFQLKPLASHPRAQLEAWRQEFLSTKIPPLITPKARQLTAKALRESDYTVIITAAHTFLAGPIAREFGITDCIATEIEERDGQFTGRPKGTPCFREGKIACLNAWLQKRKLAWESFSHTIFYSDSNNDLPLLTRVKEAVAVDPDAKLRAHAAKMGWSIISLAN